LEKSISDKECFNDIFNCLVDKIIVYKENSDNKKIKLDILFKTGESINIFSDNLGKKFHLLDTYTTNSLINDTVNITRGTSSKYAKEYDVRFNYNCFIEI
ncbi:MAG: hypothetical protein SOZ95_02925, partial [Bacilli bacterium]|nr:hypothetical protein [Bacilli bacterium]